MATSHKGRDQAESREFLSLSASEVSELGGLANV